VRANSTELTTDLHPRTTFPELEQKVYKNTARLAPRQLMITDAARPAAASVGDDIPSLHTASVTKRTVLGVGDTGTQAPHLSC